MGCVCVCASGGGKKAHLDFGGPMVDRRGK